MADDEAKRVNQKTTKIGDVHWAEKIWEELNLISETQCSIERLLSSTGINQSQHDNHDMPSIVNSHGDENNTSKSSKQRDLNAHNKSVYNTRHAKHSSYPNGNIINQPSSNTSMNTVQADFVFDEIEEELPSKRSQLFPSPKTKEFSKIKERDDPNQVRGSTGRRSVVKDRVPPKGVACQSSSKNQIYKTKLKHEEKRASKKDKNVRITSHGVGKSRHQRCSKEEPSKRNAQKHATAATHTCHSIGSRCNNAYYTSEEEVDSDQSEESSMYNVISVSFPQKDVRKTCSSKTPFLDSSNSSSRDNNIANIARSKQGQQHLQGKELCNISDSLDRMGNVDYEKRLNATSAFKADQNDDTNGWTLSVDRLSNEARAMIKDNNTKDEKERNKKNTRNYVKADKNPRLLQSLEMEVNESKLALNATEDLLRSSRINKTLF